MKKIRGGRGLGDALYVRPVVDHYVKSGEQVMVHSDYPDVFIGSGAKVQPFTRDGCDVVAHYTHGKANTETNQWQDVCKLAGVGELPMRFRWKVRNRVLVQDLLSMANGKPLIMVNGGRQPMGRADGYGRELLPCRTAFDAVLAALRDCFVVEVNKGNEVYALTADCDLSDRTSVADLLDIASVASGLVGQCGFMVPLAECFDKPLLVVWSAQAIGSRTEFIRQCTPQKILSKASSRWVMDNWSAERIQGAARALHRV